MRNLLLTFLLLFVLQSQAWGAWELDGTNDFVTMGGSSALTLPDANWTVACKIKHNTGSIAGSEQVAMEGYDGGAAWFDLLLIEDTEEVVVSTHDDDTTLVEFGSGSPQFDNTDWHTIAIVRATNTLTIFVDASSFASTTNASFDAVTLSTSWTFGAYTDESNKANITLADCAKWDRDLSGGELTAYGDFSANCFPGFQWFTPMIVNYQEIRQGMIVTNTGTVPVAGPRIIYCSD